MTDRSLMRSHQPPFEEGDHEVDSRHQLRRSLLLPLQDRDVVLVAIVPQGQVARPAVGVDYAAGSTDSFTKGNRLSAEASMIRRMRIRPIPGPSS